MALSQFAFFIEFGGVVNAGNTAIINKSVKNALERALPSFEVMSNHPFFILTSTTVKNGLNGIERIVSSAMQDLRCGDSVLKRCFFVQPTFASSGRQPSLSCIALSLLLALLKASNVPLKISLVGILMNWKEEFFPKLGSLTYWLQNMRMVQVDSTVLGLATVSFPHGDLQFIVSKLNGCWNLAGEVARIWLSSLMRMQPNRTQQNAKDAMDWDGIFSVVLGPFGDWFPITVRDSRPSIPISIHCEAASAAFASEEEPSPSNREEFNIVDENQDEKANPDDPVHHAEIPKKKIPEILILDAGGTISCERDNNNILIPGCDVIRNFVEGNPKLQSMGVVFKPVNVFHESVDSSDMSASHWKLLVKAVTKGYEDGYAGIVITHGTDTLAYTASILSFAFSVFPLPIVLTAAQYSLKEDYTDATNNLVGACVIACGHNPPNLNSPLGSGEDWFIPEVTVFMNHTLFRGSRIRKMDATEIDSFDSLTEGRLGVWAGKFRMDEEKIRAIVEGSVQRLLTNPLPFLLDLHLPDILVYNQITRCSNSVSVVECPRYVAGSDIIKQTPPLLYCSLDMWHDVCLVKVCPGPCSQAQLVLLHALGYRYFVIESFGSGNGCNTVTTWVEEKALDTKSLTYFVVVSQCPKGFVIPGVYSTSLPGHLDRVAFCSDMTVECAVAKLTIWSSNVGKDDFKYFMMTATRGECTNML